MRSCDKLPNCLDCLEVAVQQFNETGGTELDHENARMIKKAKQGDKNVFICPTEGCERTFCEVDRFNGRDFVGKVLLPVFIPAEIREDFARDGQVDTQT